MGRSKVKIKKDLTGLKFGRLTVIERGLDKTIWDATRGGSRLRAQWLCICDCGKKILSEAWPLTSSRKKSCGCLHREHLEHGNYKHGLEIHPSYSSWTHMINRCNSPRHNMYKHYGGRGIKVEDPRWLDVRNFIADMGVKPPGTSLDRIDNNKGYYKENCRWATPKQQHRNTRANVFVTFKGETHTKAGWAEKLGITIDCLKYRLKQNWPLKEALSNKTYVGTTRAKEKGSK